MIMMKKTLLNEIQDLEKQAETLVSDAKEQVALKIADIRQHTEHARLGIQEKATQTSRSIIDEHMRAAKLEASEIANQSKFIVSQVQVAAQNNRARTLETAQSFFEKEYGISL